MTELEIIDTAIKVGLGALISGVTTYLVTTRTHSHEIKKSLQHEKKELLKEASMKFERAGSLLNESRQSIYVLLIGNDPNKDKKFQELSKGLVIAFNAAKEARSLCYMIGQKKLAELVGQFCDVMEELRMHYSENRLAYDLQFVNANTDRLIAIKNTILDNLAEAFDAIYK